MNYDPNDHPMRDARDGEPRCADCENFRPERAIPFGRKVPWCWGGQRGSRGGDICAPGNFAGNCTFFKRPDRAKETRNA